MNNYECYYLNTWPFGLDLKIRAHIVNKNNHLVAKVIKIQSKDIHIPQNLAIPIWIKERYGNTIHAFALLNNKKWFLTMELKQ